MYALSPPAVYVHTSVVENPTYRARMERVAAALRNGAKPIVYSDDDLPAMINEKGITAGRVAMGTLDDVPDPILLFNTFRFDGRREEQTRWFSESCKGTGLGNLLTDALLGYGPFCWWPVKLEHADLGGDQVCRPCWRLHFQNGCVHKCQYCRLGGLLATMVNVEDYITQLDRLIELHPWQETYLLEDDAEVLCLEPELGCLGPLIEYFGTLEGRYLVIHAKSANIDWLLDLKHNGNTIIVWSIGGPTQTRELEPVAASTDERIDAARKAQAAGYTVRFKFKPIIPVPGWRREASETIAAIFERTRPDLISLCVFTWLDIDETLRRLGESALDPEMLAAARAGVGAVADSRCKPFPPEARQAIYEHHIREIRRHAPDIPISLSTESLDMWRRLGKTLGATPTNYVCGCGPNSTPNLRRLTCAPFAIAAAGPQGGFDTM